MPSKQIKLITLGCSKNTVDSEVLMRQLAENNFTFAADGEDAQTAVINTCGFIEAAKQESIDTICHALRLKEEGRIGRVIVIGCLSERYADDLRRELPGIDAIVGANRPDQVIEAIGGTYRHELVGERMLSTPRHFAYLKISEGCDRPCSFCAIPQMRGRHVSKPAERVVREAERLALLGVRELSIIAQDSTYYGLDLTGRRTLADLLRRLSEVEGIDWIRLMYAFPAGFPPEVLDVIASQSTICKYLDMPVQHCSDALLTSMKRGITGASLRKLIQTIRDRIPGVTLRTTLIVGYPGEGEREFGELMEFVAAMRFDRLGVFEYSPEEGTSAYPLGDPVPAEEKERRRMEIMALQESIALENNKRLIGSDMKVMIDERTATGGTGRTEADAPEIDNEVIVTAGAPLSPGTLLDCTITDAAAHDLSARPAAVAGRGTGQRQASSR